MTQQWGVGNKKDAKPFDRALVGKRWVDLIFGEHPHSRSDNTIYARFDENHVEGFDGHRICTRIEIEEHNYLKDSELSGSEIRKGGNVKVFMNGLQVYDDFVRSWEMGVAKARRFIEKAFGDLPIQVWRPEEWDKLKGRKIYYREIPAVIEYAIPDQACVIVRPEGIDAFPPAPYQMDEGGIGYDAYEAKTAKVEIDCPHIWWWRQ